MNLTRAELKAAVEEAHRHGLKVTGHLCSISYPEAVEAGIDDLEHDLAVIKGDPSTRIEDVENTEIVFKDGIGYDSQELIRSVAGRFGEY
jgi:hypothetical protein